MLENPKQKEGIKSEHDAGEPEIKRDQIRARCRRTRKKNDRIRARCQRTRNKRKGSNPGAMMENSKQKEGIKSERDAGEPKTKTKGSNLGTMLKQNEEIECVQRCPPLHIKSKLQSWKYYKYSFLRKSPPH